MRLICLIALMLLASCQPPLPASSPPPPEISFAWVRFSPADIEASGAGGIADRAQRRPVTIDDPVRVASISKLIVALGVMRLIEEGRLSLDDDVSKSLGWPLRNPAYPNVPITFRMLLSHTSSLQDEGDAYVIPLGRTVQDAVGAPKVFDGAHEPGTYFRYSNLNFPVIASALEKAAGERFDRLIHRLVLKPLDLDACFNWTLCSDAKVARAVILYRPDGSVARDDLGGRQPDCPVFTDAPDCDLTAYVLGSNGALFSPQGGLRISMRDLAAIGQLLLNNGRHKGRAFLSPASIALILKPAWIYDGTNGDTSGQFYCAYGLASQSLPTRVDGCSDDLFGDGRRTVGHAGDAYGVRSGLWVDPARNVGIAYFAANNDPDPSRGRSAYRAVEEWLAAKIED